MKRLALACSLSIFAQGFAAQPTSAPGVVVSSAVQRGPKSDGSGTAAFVRVADAALAYTGLVAPPTTAGSPAQQTDGAIMALESLLMRAGSDLARVVRLTAYVSTDQAVNAVMASVAKRFAATPPAFTLVRTTLPFPGALVALEAVATSSRSPAAVEMREPHLSVLPAGGKIFISGQAERGTDVGSAVKLTMSGLHRSIAHLGLKKTDVAQVKAFIKPMADHEAATREIAASFDGAAVPPMVLMEWVSDLFCEIEVVVSANSLPLPSDDSITYSWLPWLPKSPRYCNVTWIKAGTPLIFVGAVAGGDSTDPRTQMKTIFERLGSVLFEAGSSYRNLAKATYYLADPTARTLLGDIRGVYFDPTRPPAASALNMTGLGFPGRAAMVDMIAVPVK